MLLASGSEIRRQLLENAGVPITVQPARIDEETIKSALLAEDVSPRDIADALAEAKARKVSLKNPEELVLGCDQVLEFEGRMLSKPRTEEEARTQLAEMNGKRHMLLAAAVLYQGGQPKWRHIGQVRLLMRNCSGCYLNDYVTRNFDSIRHSVGGYKLEEEGVRLFTRIEGDYFNVLGLPLLELLSHLTVTGELPG